MEKDSAIFSIDTSRLSSEELSRLCELVCIASEVLNSKIAKVEPMSGGLNNKNFHAVAENGKEVAIRVAERKQFDYMNRAAEKINCGKASEYGFFPTLYYYDANDGSQIAEFIHARTLHIEDYQNSEILEITAKTIREYHECGMVFETVFDPFGNIGRFEKFLAKKRFEIEFDDYDEIKSALSSSKRLLDSTVTMLVPSHNDALAENFMLLNDTLYVIDWEFGAMNDPCYDLACVIVENILDEKREAEFLSYYFNGNPSAGDLQRIAVFKLIVTAHWAMWALTEQASGKDRDLYSKYAVDRFKQALFFSKNIPEL